MADGIMQYSNQNMNLTGHHDMKRASTGFIWYDLAPKLASHLASWLSLDYYSFQINL
jgi:hypothetical protein